MKYNYIAVQVINKRAKMCAYMLKEPANRNIWHDLNSIPGICVAQIMPTKKEAIRIVDAWNCQFKESGIYWEA